MVETLPNNSLDWAYVDASHDYEPVRKDLEAVKSKIKPGGYICGHDYIEWSRNLQRYGVIEAVHRFAIDNDWPLAYLSLVSDTNGSYALRKPS